jgi:hypothetical protein
MMVQVDPFSEARSFMPGELSRVLGGDGDPGWVVFAVCRSAFTGTRSPVSPGASRARSKSASSGSGESACIFRRLLSETENPRLGWSLQGDPAPCQPLAVPHDERPGNAGRQDTDHA